MENQRIKEEMLEEELKEEEKEKLQNEETDELEKETQETVVELTEEEIQKIEEQRLAREAFDAEEGIEFQQTINKEDAFNFNMYLLNNPSNFTRRVFTGLLGLILIIYILVIKEMYWLLALGTLMIIHAAFIYNPLQKMLTKRMFDKREFKELCIEVKFASKMKYELVEENKAPLIDYELVYKVVQTTDYIFLHIDTYSIMIIKLADCPQKEELIEFLKNKYEDKKKYKVK